jgi:hypothetical protein
MKIEKKKVSGNARLSKATKAGAATLLGMTSVFMAACVSDSDPESGTPMAPVEPTSSSDNSAGPENTSSSSIIDIPLSHERLSSSVEEALSSSAEKLSSSSIIPTSSSGGYHAFSSSIATQPSSSSEAAPASSSEESPASSSSVQTEENSSSSVRQAPSSSSINYPFERQCEMVDSTGIKVIMCHDDDRGMMASMVSTYEMSDMT